MQEYIPISTLGNGIRVIHEEVSSPISHFGVIVNAGTRDEPDDLPGLAHFAEHTFFKGTRKRNNYQITKRMENAGGDLNAYTAKEETYFHASFLSSDYERAAELLADILFNATFPEKELEKEKDVVLEEINYYKDSPAELIYDEIEEVAFSGHPLGRNILGTKKSLKSIHRDDLLSYIRTNYTADHIVLASVGNISTDNLLKLCNKYFNQPLAATSSRIRSPFTGYRPTQLHKRKNSSQTHLMLCNQAFSNKEELRVPFTLLTNLMGGQALSARLNMTLREKLGLAYTVEASYTPFSDTGLFTIYAGCENENTNRCIELIFKELKKVRDDKLGTMQLHIAKKQFLGQTAITNESKLNELLAIGRSALITDKVETPEAFAKAIEVITAEEILESANRIFIPEQFSSLIYSKN